MRLRPRKEGSMQRRRERRLAAEKGAVQFDIPGSRMVVLNNQYDKTDKKKDGGVENGC